MESKIAHLEMVQTVITRMAGNSFELSLLSVPSLVQVKAEHCYVSKT